MSQKLEADTPIKWKIRKRRLVMLSATESEYVDSLRNKGTNFNKKISVEINES